MEISPSIATGGGGGGAALGFTDFGAFDGGAFDVDALDSGFYGSTLDRFGRPMTSVTPSISAPVV